MVRKEIFVEEGGSYRKEDVNGAKITVMCLVAREKGGLSAFLDFDDGHGAATYNLTANDKTIGRDDEKGTVISDYFDFGKINKQLKALGYRMFWDEDAKTWEAEPSLIGAPVWIKNVVTGKGEKNGKPVEYTALIEVIKIGDGATPKISAPRTSTKLVSVKGELTEELYGKWKSIFAKIPAPMRDIELTQLVKKLYPDDSALRISLAEVRVLALIRGTKEGIISAETTPEGVVYNQAV